MAVVVMVRFFMFLLLFHLYGLSRGACHAVLTFCDRLCWWFFRPI